MFFTGCLQVLRYSLRTPGVDNLHAQALVRSLQALRLRHCHVAIIPVKSQPARHLLLCPGGLAWLSLPSATSALSSSACCSGSVILASHACLPPCLRPPLGSAPASAWVCQACLRAKQMETPKQQNSKMTFDSVRQRPSPQQFFVQYSCIPSACGGLEW